MTIVVYDGNKLVCDSLGTSPVGKVSVQKILRMRNTFMYSRGEQIRVKWVGAAGDMMQITSMLREIEELGSLDNYFIKLPKIVGAYRAEFIFLLEGGDAVVARPSQRGRSRYVFRLHPKNSLGHHEVGTPDEHFDVLQIGSGVEWTDKVGLVMPQSYINALEMVRLAVNSPEECGCGGDIISVTHDSELPLIEKPEHSEEFIAGFMERWFCLLTRNMLPDTVLALNNNMLKLDIERIKQTHEEVNGYQSTWKMYLDETKNRLTDEGNEFYRKMRANSPMLLGALETILGKEYKADRYIAKFASPAIFILYMVQLKDYKAINFPSDMKSLLGWIDAISTVYRMTCNKEEMDIDECSDYTKDLAELIKFAKENLEVMFSAEKDEELKQSIEGQFKYLESQIKRFNVRLKVEKVKEKAKTAAPEDEPVKLTAGVFAI